MDCINPEGTNLQDMTWLEAEAAFKAKAVAILPVGSTEAHGPHLPLQTDLLIAIETARRGAVTLARRGIRTVILPPLAYGVSTASSPFAGTITLSPTTLQGLIQDICISLANHGCTYVCISSAHLEPAHLEAIRAGARATAEAVGCKVSIPDPREERWAARLSEEFRRGARHAGCYETSLILASRPNLVRSEELKHLKPVWIDLAERFARGASTFKEAGSELAYFGDPRAASREEGEILYDVLGEMIAVTVQEMMHRR